MAAEEQRLEARIRSRGQFALFVGGEPPIPARVFDVSPNGIGLETDTQAIDDAGTAVWRTRECHAGAASSRRVAGRNLRAL